MKILALDLGTTMGWAYREVGTDIFSSGTWDLSKRNHIHKGMKYVCLWNHLKSFESIRGMMTQVVYERPGNLFGHARKVVPAIQGIIELWALSGASKEVLDHGASEVKKYATGSGAAKKPAMIAAATKKWPGIDFKTHDHCDALWLLDYHINKFLNPPNKLF